MALGLVWTARRLDFKRLGLWMYDNGRIPPGYGDGHYDKLRAGQAVVGGGRDSGVGHDPGGARAPVMVTEQSAQGV